VLKLGVTKKLFSRGWFIFGVLVTAPFSDAGTTIAAISDIGGGIAIFGQYPSPYSGGGQFGVASWTTSQTYTKVSISVSIGLFGSASSYHGAAYLTTSIGPGTTTAIASTTFAGSNPSPQAVQLFSGLTLGPGTYYLTLAGLDAEPVSGGTVGYVWAGANPNAATFRSSQAPGVTIGHQMGTTTNLSSGCGQACINPSFPPASIFDPNLFSVPYLQFSVYSAGTDSVLPQLLDGAGWTTLFSIINTDTVPVTFSFQFWGDGGTAFPFPILNGPPGVLTATLAPGASYFAQSPGTSSVLQQGWAVATSSGKIGVTAILQFSIGSPRDSLGSETSTSSGDSILIPFDNTQGKVTAIAVANTNATQSLTVSMQFATESGGQSNTSIVLPPLAHQAVVVPAINQAVAGSRGSIHFTAPSPDISVMGLEFTSAGAFTSLGAFQ